MTKIYIAGHRGMVGSAIVRQLKSKSAQLITRTHKELDLTNQQQVNDFITKEKPDQIYLAAAKVGGIHANNTYPANFIYQNLIIQANIIHAAHQNNIQKLLFLGSSCIYPKSVKQPMREESLLTGTLEPTNEPYAMAKIAGIKLCESYNRQYGTDYRSIMPTNLYGPNDNFHLENSHVIPAIIRKIHLAKCIEKSDWKAIKQDIKNNPIKGLAENSTNNQILKILAKQGIKQLKTQDSRLITDDSQLNEVEVELWGTGKPMREFLHVDDMADASIHIMDIDKKTLESEVDPMLSHINIGTGVDIMIKDVAQIVKEVVGFCGEIVFNTKMPDGTKRKLLDISKLERLGWKPVITLKDGLKETYEWFITNNKVVRVR